MTYATLPAMTLHEVIDSRRDELIRRWQAQVRGAVVPASLPVPELIDHVPGFFDAVLAALEEGTSEAGSGAKAAAQVAAVHGGQRLRLGFNLESVIREYGALQNVIVATARDAGADVTPRELRILFDCVIGGIAGAVSEYVRERDPELVHLANEHFAFIAHELRNPLATATTALQLLKAKGTLRDESPAVCGPLSGLSSPRPT